MREDFVETHDPALARAAATFGALAHEQIEAVRRVIAADRPDLSSDEGPVADHALRLVQRGAEWLGLAELHALTRDLRESLGQLGHIKPEQAEEIVAHAKVALEREEKIVDSLRSEGFGSVLAQGGLVGRALSDLRAGMTDPSDRSARDLLDEAPDVGPQETLLGLTVEIKSAIVNQNERMQAMGRTVESALGALAEQRVQDASSALRTLGYEMNHLLGLQYSLERRARDLDEHLLWEFLDPLDRFVDDLYAAVSRRPQSRQAVLTVRAGGVGFEPQIGAVLLPLLCRLIETAEPSGPEDTPEIRLVASREDLEARISLEGQLVFDRATVAMLEEALESLAGYVTLREAGESPAQLRIQFPMARALRSFLIVEASGHRVALPWSAVDRIHAPGEGPNGSEGMGPVVPLHTLFGDVGGDEAANGNADRPVAVLRCGGRSVVVAFDRIVWREGARLTALPPRLYPVTNVMGGIVAPDSSVTMVLNPCALVRKVAEEAAS
ncbi:MAG TPA: hypothetical protein VFP58_04665 [Candidatus Eisenbacteria bacterium]|nr:hypothetical protein [Candidatus Eisenbacteria bacterium]